MQQYGSSMHTAASQLPQLGDSGGPSVQSPCGQFGLPPVPLLVVVTVLDVIPPVPEVVTVVTLVVPVVVVVVGPVPVVVVL